MDWALILSAAMMGLAGAPHCAAMCGAACVAATGAQGGAGPWLFHLSRVLAYATAGAVAAASVGTLASLGQAVTALRPLWTMVHVAALGLGLWLVWQGHQPAWMERVGRSRAAAPAAAAGWQRMVGPGRSALSGLAWVAWPCGLLQSALLVAALANRTASGALVMAAFAITSSIGLVAGRMAWQRGTGGRALFGVSPAWLVRLGGATLAAASVWALGHGLWMRVAAWCFS